MRNHMTRGTEDVLLDCDVCYGADLCEALAFFDQEGVANNADTKP